MNSVYSILSELAGEEQILCCMQIVAEARQRGESMKDQLESLAAQLYSSGILYSEAVREFKKRFIMNVLAQNQGNQCKAARELGMHRNTLGRAIMELNLDVRQLRCERRMQRRPAQNESAIRQQSATA